MTDSSRLAASAEPAGRLVPRLGIRFAVTYAIIASVLFSIYGFPFELFGARTDWLTHYLEAYARLTGGVLKLFDSQVTVSGSRIDGRFALQIVRNCDAIEINILFASAVLAFPAPLLRRGAVLVRGLLILVAANVLRIACLYYVGVYSAGWFAVAHEEILPLLLVALTAMLFVLSVRQLTGKPASPPPLHSAT
ncbi:MAG: archaeosortase/exosortase family protein [Pseudomonadota bacterium]